MACAHKFCFNFGKKTPSGVKGPTKRPFCAHKDGLLVRGRCVRVDLRGFAACNKLYIYAPLTFVRALLKNPDREHTTPSFFFPALPHPGIHGEQSGADQLAAA